MTDAMDDCDTEEEREEVKKNQIFGIEYSEQYCICAEISAQSILWRKTQGGRENPAAVVRMEKGGDCRGGGMSGSHTHAS